MEGSTLYEMKLLLSCLTMSEYLRMDAWGVTPSLHNPEQ